ncbi:hypothetical protein DM828_13580 [Pseudomonas umsongensis]|nr:hypothetical protein [Pseudomonas umsongensis]
MSKSVNAEEVEGYHVGRSKMMTNLQVFRPRHQLSGESGLSRIEKNEAPLAICLTAQLCNE